MPAHKNINSHQHKNRLISGLSPLGFLALAACGGSSKGGSSAGFAQARETISEKGLLFNAFTFFDYNSNGLYDDGIGANPKEPSGRTDAFGKITLTTTQADYTIITVTDESTIDQSSGVVLSGVTFKAPSGSKMVTPTTTLMKEGNLTADQVIEVLGLPAGMDPLTFSSFATGTDAPSNADKLKVEKVSQQIMSVVSAFAAAVEGAGADQANAYSVALKSVAEIVQLKAAKLTDTNANSADKVLNLANPDDLAAIQAKVSIEVAKDTNINKDAFDQIADKTTLAVQNVNVEIGKVTNLNSMYAKNAFSTIQVLMDQVKTASKAEANGETGSIAFTDAETVKTAASNVAPSWITLSASSISEAATSLVIGELNTTDIDQPENKPFTYSIAEISGTDFASFSINQVTGELSLKSPPDFETKPSYNVTVLSTDEGGKTFSKSFTVSISDANEAPTLTVPNDGLVTEDAATSTITGTLHAFDPENGSVTYSVVGSTATGGSYMVAGTYGMLVLNASTGAYTYSLNNTATAVQALGASSSETESFSVQVTDGSNTQAAQNLRFTINGTNDAPSSITLSSTAVIENSYGASVGAFSSSDAESDTVSFSVATGDDGVSFEIDGSNNLKLKPSVAVDMETKSTYTVTVDATDGTATTSKTFTINVDDDNEAPTLMVPTDGSVKEDALKSTITGTLTGSDPENDSLTYSVVGSTASSGSYTVTGTYGTLVLNASTGAYTFTLNNSATAVQALGASSSEIENFSVQLTDSFNTTTAQNLSFTIQGADDAPSSVTLSGTSVFENSAGAIVGVLSASDAEGSDVSYSIADAGDATSFEIYGSNILMLKSSVTADFEDKSSYSIIVDASDGDLTTSKNFIISISDVNEAPTLTVPTGGAVTEDAAKSTISGTLIGSDPENDSLTYSVVGSTAASGIYTVSGKYGTLVLNSSTGTYTYTLDKTSTAVQNLGASNSELESFSVQITDGSNTPSAKSLSFTINGSGSTSVTGFVQNGPLANAWSFLDLDNDGLWDDETETRIRTEAADGANGAGYYALSTTATDYTLVAYTDETTVDTKTNTPYGAGVTLKAPIGSKMITPNTTLVESFMAADPGSTAAEAASKVATVMGLPAGLDVTTYDAYADQSTMTDDQKTTALAVQTANNKIMTVVNTFAAVADGSGMAASDAFNLAIGAMADVVKAKITAGLKLNFTTDLAAIVTEVKASLSIHAAANPTLNISVSEFNSVMVEAEKAVNNVVTKIEALTITNSDADKLAVIGIIGSVVKEVKAAAIVVEGGGTLVIDSATLSNLEAKISNNAPSDITLTSGDSVVTTVEIAENAQSLVIGTMAAVDVDTDDTFRFAVSGGDDAAKFMINANTGVLSLLAQPDYETQTSYEVGVKVTDTGGTGKTYVEVFTITVGDILEGNTFGINSSKVVWTDYDPSTEADITNTAHSSTSGTAVIFGSEAIKLNLTNLINFTDGDAATVGKSPDLKFTLDTVPIGAGIGTVTATITDGYNAVRTDTESQLSLEVKVNYSGDGTVATLSVPGQTAAGSYTKSDGATVTFNLKNVDSDAFSITAADAVTSLPASLSVKMDALYNAFVSGAGNSSFLIAGTYNLKVETTLPLQDAAKTDVTTFSTNVELVASTPTNTLTGTAIADTLIGGATAEVIDAGKGVDTIATGAGDDLVVLRTGDGSSTSITDTVSDFIVGTDKFQLNGGLVFTDLNIAADSANSDNSVITIIASNEYLMVVADVVFSALTSDDFIAVDIA